jgi:hypothetical protein
VNRGATDSHAYRAEAWGPPPAAGGAGAAAWAGAARGAPAGRGGRARAGRRAPPLDSLTLDWPAEAADARIAYLLSASAVAFLIERSGERGLRIFLERWRDEQDFEAAFRAIYGRTLGQFEADWRRHVRRTYGWGVLLGHSVIFWGIAALILLVLFGVPRPARASRSRHADSQSHSPAAHCAYPSVNQRGVRASPR